MYGGPFVMQGILVHNTIDGAFLGLDFSTNCTNVNVGAMMIIDTSDISSLSSFKDGAYICTCYTSISTSINA
jgi:hypothetical protein